MRVITGQKEFSPKANYFSYLAHSPLKLTSELKKKKKMYTKIYTVEIPSTSPNSASWNISFKAES